MCSCHDMVLDLGTNHQLSDCQLVGLDLAVVLVLREGVVVALESRLQQLREPGVVEGSAGDEYRSK